MREFGFDQKMFVRVTVMAETLEEANDILEPVLMGMELKDGWVDVFNSQLQKQGSTAVLKYVGALDTEDGYTLYVDEEEVDDDWKNEQEPALNTDNEPN